MSSSMSLRRPELVNSAEHFPELKIKQVDGSLTLAPLPTPGSQRNPNPRAGQRLPLGRVLYYFILLFCFIYCGW